MSDSLNHTAIIGMMLNAIGENPTREGLKDTPTRVAKSWQELYAGYRMNPKEILARRFQLEQPHDEMIVLSNIEFFSTCEHHMLPFFGKAHVGYVPTGSNVVGLSKLARLVECFARRLQIQERLTSQIGEALDRELSPVGVGVVIEAQHTCMIARGIMKQGATMTTSYLSGALREKPAARAEFLALVRR